MQLLTSESMQWLEKTLTEKYQIPTQILMENAGRNIAELASRFLGDNRWRQISVVCGKGNNGGDGFVVARHLALRFPSLPLTIYLVGNPESLKNDSLVNYKICQQLGLPIHRIFTGSPPCFGNQSLIIDALFGTGISKTVEGVYREVIEAINAAPESLVIAVDIPSGVDATWGKIMGNAVKAHHTVTLGMMKRGLVVSPGREYSGQIHLVDIGMPFTDSEVTLPNDGFLITPDTIRPFLPDKPFMCNKISAGVVMVVAGSPAMTGAGLLTCQGAYRSGAGMVIWPTIPELAPFIKIYLPEVVSHVLSNRYSSFSHGYLPHHTIEIVEEMNRKKCRALAIGPGLGQNPAIGLFVEKIIECSPVKGVIDADALNVIAHNREYWKDRLSGWVITPHEGELGRLLNCPASSIAENRIAAACSTTQYYGCITVLKGPGTIVVSPTGEIAVNATGNSGLATAGSGDVLTGMIASFLAQGKSPFSSAITAAFLHGLAAELIQNDKNELIASDIASHIPHAIKVVKNREYRLSIVDGDSFPTSS